MKKSEALKNIVLEANQGELVFPTNVNASLKIQQLLDDPDCSLEAAAKLTLTEPLLASRVVAIANSVAYARFGGGVTNVRTAVTILGFSTLRSIVASVVVRQLSYAIGNPALRQKAYQLWEHSAHVAALAHTLAIKVSNTDPETAMFAGIVHEVSGFYLLSRADQLPALMDEDSDGNQDCLGEITEPAEVVIGRAVLKKLLLPKRIVTAVEALWSGIRVMPPETLGDTLVLANDLAPVASPLDPRSPETIRQAASEIDFLVGDGTVHHILEESDNEVKALTVSLMT
ncbi:HDOD domain-containing protein [Undibacterium sp. Jales W-56]|uniref:HDOD domain-containing protein n=1 Tax=Undibacterium sp. Jales W-56 TaxID=2897325 RepID=UPI0021D1883C|nr:HDOD domain-containing protein [Undibacterium sp. Jales W-56]MCU6434272.1 HDOD domain-containing protein [Undibacterium sp. Jales W-56]